MAARIVVDACKLGRLGQEERLTVATYLLHQARSFAAKPSKSAGKGAASAPPATDAAESGSARPKIIRDYTKLDTTPKGTIINPMYFIAKHNRPPLSPNPLKLLTEEQRELAEKLAMPLYKPEPPKLPGSAEGNEQENEAEVGAEFTSLKQIGLPLDERDVITLLHENLSNLAGHHVHVRPYVFSSVFQSAPAVAAYVAAALEQGQTWPRLERLFLLCAETDPNVKGIRVIIRGRMGRTASKAEIASQKKFEYGAMSLATFRDFVDQGQACALTRFGLMGVNVWIRYHDHSIRQSYWKKQPFKQPLHQVLTAKRERLPGLPCSGWWATSGPQQPLENETWKAGKLAAPVPETSPPPDSDMHAAEDAPAPVIHQEAPAIAG